MFSMMPEATRMNGDAAGPPRLFPFAACRRATPGAGRKSTSSLHVKDVGFASPREIPFPSLLSGLSLETLSGVHFVHFACVESRSGVQLVHFARDETLPGVHFVHFAPPSSAGVGTEGGPSLGKAQLIPLLPPFIRRSAELCETRQVVLYSGQSPALLKDEA